MAKALGDLGTEERDELVSALSEAEPDDLLEQIVEALELEDEGDAVPVLLSLVSEGAVVVDGAQAVYDAMAWEPLDHTPASVAALLAQTTRFEPAEDDDGGSHDDEDDDYGGDEYDDDYDDYDDYGGEEDEDEDEDEEPEVGEFLSAELDKVTVGAHARDKSAFEGWTEYAPMVRTWFATVVARAGDPVPEAIGHETLDALAAQQILNWGGDQKWNVWQGESVEEVPFYDDVSREQPNARFDGLIEALGGKAVFAEKLHAWAMKKTYDLNGRRARPGLAIAELDQLPRLLDALGGSGEVEVTYGVLLDDRDDEVDELLALADQLQEGDYSNYDMVRLVNVCAALRARDRGVAWPEANDARLELNATDSVVEKGAARFEGVERAAALLEFLGRERAIAVLERTLSEPMAAKCLPIVAAFGDEVVTKLAIGRVLGDLKGWYGDVVYGLASFGPSIIPALRAHAKSHADQTVTADLVSTIVAVIMGDQLDRGEVPEPDLDADLVFDSWAEAETIFSGELSNIYERVLPRLAKERARAAVGRALDAGRHPAIRVLNLVHLFAEPQLTDRAFDIATAEPKALNDDQRRYIRTGLAHLDDAGKGAQIRRLLAAKPDKVLAKILSDSVGEWAFGEYMKAAEGVAEIKAETKAEQIQRLASDLGDVAGGTTRIYLLERDEGSAKGLSRVGAAPYPEDASWWPTNDAGDKRQHLITLAVADVPALKTAFPDVLAVSLFIDDPDDNEAYEADNDETELVAVPADAEVDGDEDGCGVSVVAVDVPSATFTAFDGMGDVEDESLPAEQLRELRGAIYQAIGRAGGEPLWLQSPEYGVGFLFQFDESLVPMNLGDAGIMYVFADTAFWQCH